jgi:hypothetical protein
VTVAADYQRRVTGSHIRMYAPEVVAAMVAEVQEGKLPKWELFSVVGRRMGPALLKVKPDVMLERLLRPKVRVKPVPGRVVQKAVPSPPSYESLQAAAAAVGGHKYIVEHEPSQIDFAPLWEGQRAEAVLVVTAPMAGIVRADLPRNHNFRIFRMRAEMGTVRLGPKGGLTTQFTQRTSPPWTLTARAGQNIVFKIRFEPVLKLLANMAGRKTATLSIRGQGWRLAVPIKGYFNGRRLGVIAFPANSEITVVKPESYRPDFPEYFKAEVTLVNSKGPIEGTIGPVNLPPGVSRAGAARAVNVSLAAQETRTVRIGFKMDRMGGIWLEPHEVPHPIRLRCQFGQQVSYVDFYVLLYKGYHKWKTGKMEVGSCDIWASLYLGSSGNFKFSAYGFNSDLIYDRQVLFNGRFDGIRYVNAAVTAPSGNELFSTSYGFHRQVFEDQYLSLIKKQFILQVKVRHPL